MFFLVIILALFTLAAALAILVEANGIVRRDPPGFWYRTGYALGGRQASTRGELRRGWFSGGQFLPTRTPPENISRTAHTLPELTTRHYSMDAETLYDRLCLGCRRLGWQVVRQSSESLCIEAVTPRTEYGFSCSVRAVASPERGGATLDIDAVSRPGPVDFGLSSRRIIELIAAVDGYDNASTRPAPTRAVHRGPLAPMPESVQYQTDLPADDQPTPAVLVHRVSRSNDVFYRR